MLAKAVSSKGFGVVCSTSRRALSSSAGSLLPVVSLGGSNEEAAAQLRSAAGKFGFFYVANHGVSAETQAKAWSELKGLFADEERKNRISEEFTKSFRGYVGFFKQGNYAIDETDLRKDSPNAQPEEEKEDAMDNKEVFHFGTEIPATHKFYNDLLYCENVWPEDKKGAFKEALSTYYSQVEGVSNRLLQISALALELEEDFFLKQASKTPMSSMNCLHYPPLEQRGSQLGIGAHTDFECLTVLNMTGTSDPCLEILSPIDNKWIPVAPREGCFVVNIGDMLARWSGDTFRSTVHRAFNHPKDHRYSMAFFRGPDFDAMLEPQVGNKTKYTPAVRAGEHMLARISQANPSASVYTKLPNIDKEP
mmetsp:Transcript_10542/g.20765  ORF Transcript_10542/g.20765 Transcript_10542/m.20765 type:complete len:364 (-) Transcript_10542:420-1511(-)|eukprot:CAMPEP_0171520954 /NCGR_PEP_ID=MMETSP0959-20130129/6843_1 /TAXON_ID=87120 /ORGANISM="Aurantiochytrium limacinum, Strain ATCCMYA-1381" /LENGTH=363 /DNA_ID=CAMNT_0012060761 /DNA_START=213 /DNA_END=1304 /DNA_ORIENTATION=-